MVENCTSSSHLSSLLPLLVCFPSCEIGTGTSPSRLSLLASHHRPDVSKFRSGRVRLSGACKASWHRWISPWLPPRWYCSSPLSQSRFNQLNNLLCYHFLVLMLNLHLHLPVTSRHRWLQLNSNIWRICWSMASSVRFLIKFFNAFIVAHSTVESKWRSLARIRNNVSDVLILIWTSSDFMVTMMTWCE